MAEEITDLPTMAIDSLTRAVATYNDALVDLIRVVADARDAGCTWDQIGKEFGVSRQAAQRRWGKVVLTVDEDWGRKLNDQINAEAEETDDREW